MDRGLLYDGAQPLSTDVLGPQRMALYSIGRLCEALFGTTTFVSGLACNPTGPPSLAVNVNYGSIYMQAQMDSTAYGDLGTDLNLVVKQGLIQPLNTSTLVAQQFNLTAPGTPGQSQNYLIQATYVDTDNTPVVLPFLNVSNPPTSYASPWSGPNNSGSALNTIRSGVCVLSMKAGTPATTGTQVTPTPDGNNVGLWVITVAQGQATVTSGNISQYTSAPFITNITTQQTLFSFREVIQTVTPFGVPPATANLLGDTPIMVFTKANTPSIFFSFPVTTKMNLSLPIRLRLLYTNDLNGGNNYIQVGYQAFTVGSAISPASYTNLAEAVPAPGVAGQFAQYVTSTAVIPANALVLNGYINVVLSRQGPNGLDTNNGNFQLLQINLEQ